MRNKIMKTKLLLGSAIFLSSLLVLSLCSSGCEPLRKKFVRKRKGEVKVPDPILQPVDYEKERNFPDRRYGYHYSLWRVWSKELMTSIDDKDSPKRQTGLMSHCMEQLKQMQALLSEPKFTEMGKVITQFQSVDQELNKPAPLRNMVLIQDLLERYSKEIRLNFNSEVLKGSYK